MESQPFDRLLLVLVQLRLQQVADQRRVRTHLDWFLGCFEGKVSRGVGILFIETRRLGFTGSKNDAEVFVEREFLGHLPLT